MSSRDIGERAEKAACIYLRSHGLKTVCQNFRCRFGEIDIIMRDKTTLVFVEVRFRRQADYGHPVETVDRHKQERIGRTAQIFLQENPKFTDHELRFDVIGIKPDRDNPDRYAFDWIRHAFEF
ncbi:MAG: YraN family protein [Gammaproteobacteria bacterium]|nr:MAG: YraN family protein [Gammaproteobacteria bacterium]